MNAYEVLGVGKEATQDEIKRAYRKKAAKQHPDVKGVKDGESFKMLVAAFECVGDTDNRKYYDEHGTKEKKHSRIETDIAAMVVEAFAKEEEPIKWMKSRVNERRTQGLKHLTGCEAMIDLVKSNLKKFMKANKKSKTPEKVEFIKGILEFEILRHETAHTEIQKGLEHLADLKLYLEHMVDEAKSRPVWVDGGFTTTNGKNITGISWE